MTWAWAAGLSGAGVHDGSVTVIQLLTFTGRGPRVGVFHMAGRYQALARVLHCFWLHGFDGGCSPTVPPFPWLFGKVATRA